jgi:hypothetical protein
VNGLDIYENSAEDNFEGERSAAEKLVRTEKMFANF